MHEAFHEGPEVWSESQGLWAEFQACIELGIDPDIQFAKNRYSRMLIAGGVLASRSISTMRQYDVEKMREQKTKLKGRRNKNG